MGCEFHSLSSWALIRAPRATSYTRGLYVQQAAGNVDVNEYIGMPRVCAVAPAQLRSLVQPQRRKPTGNEEEATECRADPQRRHGLFRYRLLRRRNRHAEPRPAGGERSALLAVLQHRALQPVAR